MKYFYQILIITAAVAISSCSSSRYYQSNPDEYSQNYDQEQTITYQQFYNDLSPYGNWVNYDNYGYVWVPGISNFRPYYSNGRWAYTDYGWTWVSDYSWGWAPFHYGRWINDYNYGWMWVPGYQWAPAWVSWRSGGNYYGWAPLSPGMDANISIGSIPYNDWTFVPGRYITSPRINNYYVNRSRNVTIINNTTIINNYNNDYGRNNGRNYSGYNQGPRVTDVERTTGSRVRKYNIVESGKPEASQMNSSSIRVFRPTVNQQATTSEAPRPSKIMDISQVRNTSRNATNATNNTNNENRQPAAPVREFPKNQTPQINRNEPPVNNDMPAITPERNKVPARTFPRQLNNQPATANPVPQNDTRVSPPENQPQNQPAVNPNRNNMPVRTFPGNQRQFNRNYQQSNQQSVPVQPAPQKKDERLNLPPQDGARNNNYPTHQQPVRQFNNQRNEKQVESRQMENPNLPASHENTEKQKISPDQDTREIHQRQD